LIEDAPSLPLAPIRDHNGLPAYLAERGVTTVSWQGWQAIELAESLLGQARGSARARITDRAALLAAALGATKAV
jgi:ferredoxin--NADP+ reductase